MPVIEIGVPLPEPWGAVTASLRLLDTGESILIPTEKRSGVFLLAKRSGIKVCTRQAEDKQQVRVWRIA